jgi:hypothetical protein
LEQARGQIQIVEEGEEEEEFLFYNVLSVTFIFGIVRHLEIFKQLSESRSLFFTS